MTNARHPFAHLPMFKDKRNAMATIVAAAAVAYFAIRFLRWALLGAVWALPPGAGSAMCRQVQGHGACWAVIGDRARFILLGSYPFNEQWRPALVCLMFAGLYASSTRPQWWRPWLAASWLAVPVVSVVLLLGGILGLREVPTEFWGGLPLTFLFSTIGLTAAFPFAVLLALGRRSAMPAIRTVSVAYIELMRGIPIITLLFMAAVMFPLLVPHGVAVDKLLRAQVALTIVYAAYLAEVVRAGLESLPRGQVEAAASLGLSYWPMTLLVMLPQALRVTIPALVNTFIGLFKDTSLVAVIGVFDLLGAAKAVIVDPQWVGFGVEVYLFVGAVYFAFCFAVSRYSQQLEQRLSARQAY